MTDRHDSAVDYYYASRLKGEVTASEDIHFYPVEGLSFRLTVVAEF